MDIRNVLQDCLLLLFFFPLYHGLFIDEDYEDTPSFGRCPYIRNKLKNGRVRYRSRGRVAKFLCDSGFELAGKRSSICVKGQWNNPLPVCVARGCNRVPTIPNGRVTEMYRGALLVYDCNPGYTLTRDSSIHCDGRRWNATAPSCAVSIQDPESHCDFETSDLCGWTHDPIHDFDWRRNQFATPSGHVGTGPSFDHTFGENKAGYYLYIEASSPRKPNDVARLFSPVYHSEESGGCFIFWYHMYGTNTGGLRVYLKPESYVFNELSPKWQEFGDHGNQWLRGNISVPVFRENFQIVIEGVRGDGYMGDSAIDDVYLTKQDCESMENETDIHSEDSTDSCRGRCRGSDSVDACGCNENCHAADNCCSDYISLCFEANDTLVPDTDEALPGDDGKSSSFATVTAILNESTDGQTKALSAKLTTESPNQFSTVVSSNTLSSGPSSSNSPDSTMSTVLPETSLSSTEGSISSSIATAIITMNRSTPERKPETVFPSSSSSTTISIPNIADTSLSSITEKTTNKLTSSVGTTISLKFSPTTTSSSKSSSSTTNSIKSSPSPTISIKTSSVAKTTENITSSTQRATTSTIQISTESTSINSTPNQTLTSEITSTQNSKDLNQTVLYLTTESSTSSKLTFTDSFSLSTTSVSPSTSTPRYNLRPRTLSTTPALPITDVSPITSNRRYPLRPTLKPMKTTTVSSTVNFTKKSSLSTISSFSSTTTTSKSETSTTPVTISKTSRTRSLFNITIPPVFTSRSFTRKPTEIATTKSSNIQTNTVPNHFKTTQFRIPRPSILTFPSTSPTTADSFEMISSKGSDSSAAIITVVIIILLCVIGGTIFYIKKYKGKRQSKLDDDSELRFLPENDNMEYSDASALDKIMNSPTTADSFEMISSKGSDSSAAVITIVNIILLCVIGGTIFYIKKYRGKRQSKLDDDSEMRFLPGNDHRCFSFGQNHGE